MRPPDNGEGTASPTAPSAPIKTPYHEDHPQGSPGVEALTLILAAFPGATLDDLDDTDLGGHALAYAIDGWEVFPLRGKAPLIPKRAGGAGVLDATRDLATITGWWERWPDANIGGRIPRGVAVIDDDPRHRPTGWPSIANAHQPLPATLTAISGRGDGGSHRYWLHPGGDISAKRLPPGYDIKTHAGYCVLPPSIHPDSGQRYRWLDPGAAIVALPPWVVDLLRPPPPPPRRHRFTRPRRCSGHSVADAFTAATTWPEVLEPHGWTETGPGQWRHPAATNAVSATVTNDCLFVYSTGTPFEPTQPGAPHGYTRFRAWAVLNYGGDLSAAARALRGAR